MPVVLVHGTASSPARWAELINELENDPRFWQHYEIWLFIYNTGNPIAYSASLLRDALTKAVADLDPEGKDPGLKQMVVIGHSQGGLLTKMTVIDSGKGLWPFTVPPEQLDVSAETRELLTDALIIKPLPFVKSVIFVATPHRGSYQALGFLGSLASWLVNMPGRFVKFNVELLRLQARGLTLATVGGVPTAVDNMSPGNLFIRNLSAIPIAPGVVAYSIIAVDSDEPLDQAGDGVVKYMSAHIDGVASEKIVRSEHSVQGNPEAIQEIKRILIEHAKGLPALSEKSSVTLNK
jgi:pimeloyl-ACP methyl ester carboxylesterase